MSWAKFYSSAIEALKGHPRKILFVIACVAPLPLAATGLNSTHACLFVFFLYIFYLFFDDREGERILEEKRLDIERLEQKLNERRVIKDAKRQRRLSHNDGNDD